MMNEEVKKETTELAEITKADQELTELVEKHENRIYDLTTTKGMAACVSARAEFRNFRIGLGKTSKSVKSRLNEIKRKIDFETNRITDKVKLHEGPLDIQIKARETELAEAKRIKDEAEKERVNTIQNLIHNLTGTPDRCVGLGSEKIGDTIAGLANYEITAFFEEFQDQARAAVSTAVDRLKDMQCEAAKREADERARKEEAERLAAQKVEQDRRQAELDAQAAAIETERVKQEKEEVAKLAAKKEEEPKPEPVPERTTDPDSKPGIEPEKEPTAMRECIEKPKTLKELRQANAPAPRSACLPYVPSSKIKAFEKEILVMADEYWVPHRPSAEDFAAWISEHMVKQFKGE